MNQQNLHYSQFQVGQTLNLSIQDQQERKLRITKHLAEGNSGIMFQAELINQGLVQKCALKIHNTEQSREYIDFIEKLITYQKNNQEIPNSSHSNIIKIYEQFIINQNKLVIIMELGGQNLYEFLESKENKELSTINDYCIQMAKAISFLHKNQFIHRNLKPENFILVQQIVKLIDFGLIKNNNDFSKTLNIGTPLYQAPEIIMNKDDYTQSVDIWSLGCVYYELIQNEPLFNFQKLIEVEQQIIKHITDQQYVNDKINSMQISFLWKQILLQMLNPQPQNRPNIKDISEFIQKFSILPNSMFTSKMKIDFELERQFELSQQLNSNQNGAKKEQKLNTIILQDKNIYTNPLSSEDQIFQDQNINILNLKLEDKIELVIRLIDEIQNDQKSKEQKMFFVKILELKSKVEIMKKEEQERNSKQQEIKKLQDQIDQINKKLSMQTKKNDLEKITEMEIQKLKLQRLEAIEKDLKNQKSSTSSQNQSLQQLIYQKETEIQKII